jgi:hypothetical protein
MSNNPVPPKGFKLVEDLGKCPKCGATCIVKRCPQKHCNQCGHEWPPVERVILGPSRREVLEGMGDFQPTRVIRWR